MLWVGLSVLGLGQGHPLLDNFSVRQVGDHIQLDFGIIGGASCNGVQLLRSADGEKFYQINEIQGICGGSEFTEQYTLIDDSPFQSTTNHYKLVLGTQGESEVLMIQFVDLDAGYNIAPNPVQEWVLIRFDNPTEKAFEFSMFDLAGAQVRPNTVVTSAEIHLWLSDLIPGIYIFQLKGEDGRLITGKILRV